MMTSISFFWKKYLFAELKDYDDHYLYAISRNDKLLYIGSSTGDKSHVRLRISDHIKNKFKDDTDNLIVWFGAYQINSHSRVSKKMVLDAESLLIFLNQPEMNVSHKKSYSGRANLRIISHECPLLLRVIQSVDYKLSPRTRLPKNLR